MGRGLIRRTLWTYLRKSSAGNIYYSPSANIGWSAIFGLRWTFLLCIALLRPREASWKGNAFVHRVQKSSALAGSSPVLEANQYFPLRQATGLGTHCIIVRFQRRTNSLEFGLNLHLWGIFTMYVWKVAREGALLHYSDSYSQCGFFIACW